MNHKLFETCFKLFQKCHKSFPKCFSTLILIVILTVFEFFGSFLFLMCILNYSTNIKLINEYTFGDLPHLIQTFICHVVINGEINSFFGDNVENNLFSALISLSKKTFVDPK